MSGARCGAVLVCAGCLWVLAGCAAVKTTMANGSEVYSIHPFGLGYDRPPDGLQHISAAMFGVTRNAEGFDLGYRKEDVVIAPQSSCQAVFVVNTPQQADAARELARDVGGHCAVRR